MKMLSPGTIGLQVEPAVVTTSFFVFVVLPTAFVAVRLIVYVFTAVKLGLNVLPVPVTGDAVVGETDHEYVQPSATGSTFVEATVKVHGGPPFVQLPPMTKSGVLSGFVNASLVVIPAQAAPTPLGADKTRCAFKPCLPLKLVFGTTNCGIASALAVPLCGP